MALAEKYIKQAGYPSGKYSGGETVTIVGAKGAPAEQDAEIVNSTLKSLGFNNEIHARRNARRCTRSTATCPKKRSRLPERRLDRRLRRPADGPQHHVQRQIHLPTGNVNWSQANDPNINEAMDEAERSTARRARQGVGEDRRRNRRKSHRDPVRLGQAGEHRGQGRPRRRRAVERRRVGLRLDVAEVSAAQPS